MKKILLLILIFNLASCSSVVEKKPNKATLQNQKIKDGMKMHSLIFKKIDGSNIDGINLTQLFTPPNKSVYYVTPGKRELDLVVTLYSESSDIVWAAKFNVTTNLKSNEIYTLRASERNWCIKVEVVNSKGEILAGPKFKKLYPFLSFNDMKNKALMAEVFKKTNNAKCI